MLQRFRLHGAFDAVQGMSNTLALGKSRSARHLLELFHVDRQSTVMVGDTAHDAEVAHGLGVDCILLATGHQSRDRLTGLQCPVVDSLETLAAELIQV